MAPKVAPMSRQSRGRMMAMMAQDEAQKSKAKKTPKRALAVTPAAAVDAAKRPRLSAGRDELLAPAARAQLRPDPPAATPVPAQRVSPTVTPPRPAQSTPPAVAAPPPLPGAHQTPYVRRPALPLHPVQRRNTTVTQHVKTQEQRQAAGPPAFFARRNYMRPAAGRGGGPVGMVNLGNTCYLNAVLQVLLSLPGFVGDLRQVQETLGTALPADGVAAALLECVAAKASRGSQGFFAPVSLKKAMGARLAAFQGAFQQDAHEFFCGLLDVLQGEVLAAEAARLGRPLIRVSETQDPAARSFSFAVCHELACTLCGHTSSVTEEFLHLSLELPPAAEGEGFVPPDVNSLLRAYFKEEELEKRCEQCGAQAAAHRVQHSIRRLPRVLALHVKRFQVTLSSDGTASCQKVSRPVGIPPTVSLSKQMAAGALPPLAMLGGEGAGVEAGKENRGQAANQAGAAGGRAAGGAPAVGSPAAVAEEGALPSKSPRSHPLPQSKPWSSFYSAAKRTPGRDPYAFDNPGSTPALSPRRGGSAHAALGAEALLQAAEGLSQEERDLQRALALSLQDQQEAGVSPGGWRAQQQQQRQQPAAGGLAASGAGRQPLQPLHADGRSGSPSQAQHARGLGSSAAAGGTGAAAQQQQQQPGAGGGSSQEDAELQRALALSLLEAQQAQQGAQQTQQDAQPREPEFSFVDLQSPTAAAATTTIPAAAGVAAVAAAAAAVQPGRPSERRASDGGSGWPEPELLQVSPLAEEARPCVVDLFSGVAAGEAGGESAGCGSPSWLAGAVGGGGIGQCSGAAEEAGPQLEQQPEQQQQQLVARPLARIVEDDVEVGAGPLKREAPLKKPLGQYSLQSIVNHSGSSALCGHFTADVRGPTGWFRHNDSLVTPISAGEAAGPISQRECYMLFYVFDN